MDIASLAFTKGNAAFVDENYEEALSHYNEAIKINNNSDYYVKRSTCNYKLKNYIDAVSDANNAIKLNANNATAYLRKGMACFAIDEFETALIAFQKGLVLDSSNTQFKTWIRKCEAEIEAGDDNNSTNIPASVTATTPSQTPPQPVQTPQPVIQPQPVTQPLPQPVQTPQPVIQPQPVQTPQPAQTPVNHTNGDTPIVQKYKQDWFQSNDFVEIGLFIKKVKKEQAEINIKEKSISIHIKLLDSDYISEIELFESVIPEECKIEFLSTKIEINLKKKSS